MGEQEKIAAFKEWLQTNKKHCPLNAITWNIQIVSTRTLKNEDKISLGKYDASKKSTIPFYKSYSRTFIV